MNAFSPQDKTLAFGGSEKTRRSSDSLNHFDDIWNNIEGSLRVYQTGTQLYKQGDPADDVLFIGEGLVKLVRLEFDGQEQIVDLRFPGSLIGTAPVIVQTPHLVTAVALSNCWVRRIPAGVFRHLMQSNSRLSWHLHQLHSRKISNHVMRLTQLGCLSAQQRLEELFWRLINSLELEEKNKEVRLQLPLKQQEMAALIAITPEYLSRMLKRMQLKGILRQEKGWLIISNYENLWHHEEA